MKAIKEDREFEMNNPDIFCDYIHVDTFAQFVLWTLEKGSLGAINLGSGNSQSMGTWYQSMKNDNKEITEQYQPSKNSRIPNCSKIKALGFWNHA